MAIKGTDIVKRLPKTNCKECGFPTCFAFAMKLATAGVSLDLCPYLSPEVKAELEDALAPPIKPVTIGTGDNAIIIGDEEVVYRHEKTFVHEPSIALLISDTESEAEVESKVQKLKDLQFEWVGRTLKANLYALCYESGDKSRYEALVRRVYEGTDLGLVLVAEDLDALFSARDICAERRPLLYPITEDNIDEAIPRIERSPTPVAVRGDGLEGLASLTSKLKDAGIDELVLDPGSKSLQEAIRDQTFIRRAALRQEFRPLGYPTIAFPYFMAQEGLKEALTAAVFVDKWAALIVLSDVDRFTLLPLLVQRLNIYTDPRIPMTVEEKIYEINEPDEESPILVTTNYALTYFIVASEIEGSRVPAFLLVQDTEGLGVLTAWAAGKFVSDTVGPFVKKSGIEDRAKHRKLIIPGRVARIRGELEDELSGWEIVVGPREASDIPKFLPDFAKGLRS